MNIIGKNFVIGCNQANEEFHGLNCVVISIANIDRVNWANVQLDDGYYTSVVFADLIKKPID